MSEVKETTNTIAGTALAAQIDAAKPETAEEQEIRLLKETLTKQKEHLLEVAKLRQPLTEGLWLAESIPVGNHIFLNLDLELTKALANNDTQTASKIAEIALKLAQKQLQEHGLLNLMTASHSITALKIWLRSGSEAGPAKDHLDEITRRMLNIDLASTRNFDLYEKQLAELALVGSQLGANPSQTRQLLVGITNSIGKNRENKNYIGILEDLSDIRTEEAKDFTRHIAISLAQNEIQYQPLVGHITDMLLKKDLHDEALDFTEQIKKHQSEPNRTRLLLNSAAAYIQNGFLDEAYETLSDCVLLEIQESSLLERIFESGFDITHLTPELKAALLRFAKADNRAYLIIKVIATLFEQGKESQALLIAKEVESNQTIVGVASRLLLSKLTVEARSLIKSKNISAKDSAPYYVTLAKALPIKEYITELTHYDLDQETQASFIGLYAAQHKRFIASNVPLGGRMLTADSQESIQRDAAEFTELIETVFSTPEYQQEVGLLLAITKLTRELPIHASVVQKVVEKLTPALESLSCTPETVAQYLEGHAVLSQHNPAISAREVYETALPHIPTQDASIHLATLIRIANNTNDAELSNTLHNLLNQKETATQSSSERAQLLEQFLYGNELEKAEAFLTDATTETAELVVLDLFFQGKGSQALEILKRFPTVPSARFIQYSIAANAPYIGELTEFITKIGEKSNYGDLAKIIEMLLLTDHIAEGLQAISTLITFKQRYIIDNLSESFKLLTEAGKDGPLQVVITRLLREEGIQYSHILAELTSLKNTSVLLDVLAQAEADLKENPTRPQLKSISYAYNEAYRYLRNQGKEKEAEHYLQLFRTNTFETYFIDELAWKKITHFLEQTQGSPLPEISGKDLADLRDTLQKLNQPPDKEILRALTTLRVGSDKREAFLKLAPYVDRTELKAQTSPFSRETVLETYGALLSEEARTFIQNPTIPFERIFKDWYNAGPDKTETFRANITLFMELEAEHPGIIATLTSAKTFNLSTLSRYPKEALVDMFTVTTAALEAKKNGPPLPPVKFGTVLLAKEDWNGALLTTQGVYQDLHTQLKEKGYHIAFVEAESRIGAGKRLLSTKKIYNNRISFMVIHAHGEKEGFYLNDQSESIRASDFTSTLNQKIITRLEEEVYTPEMPWLFISCSTGAEDGIVSKVAKAFKGIAKGPKKNTGVSKITATFNSENDIAALSGTFTSNEGLVEEATYKQ